MSGKLIVKTVDKMIGIGNDYRVFLDGQKVLSLGRNETAELEINKDASLYVSVGKHKASSTVIINKDDVTTVTCDRSSMTYACIIKVDKNDSNNDENPIYFLDGGVGDKLTVYEDRIKIQHKGVRNFLAMGINGDKTVYLLDISAIQFKPAGDLSGNIQFSIIGSNESKTGILAAASDENAVMFTSAKNYDAEEIYKYLNNKLRELKNKRNSSIIQTAPLSSADELKKFKELLDIGVITQEEFDQKKKQLLGL